MTLYRILDSNNEEIDTLDDGKSCFGCYHGEYCGGCDSCLLMQASYYGYKIEKVETNEH